MPNIRPISSELAKKAEIELSEFPETIDQHITVLRTWLTQQSQLRVKLDDQSLITFLRSSKYSLERSKNKILLYYTAVSAIPELFTNRDVNDEKIRKVIKLGFYLPLPKPESVDGPIVFLMRPGCYNPSKYTLAEIMKVCLMVTEILLRDCDQLVISGQVIILDLNGVGLNHLFQFSPTMIKKMTLLGNDASSLRQKGFHYINMPPGFETILKTFKGFLSEKSKTRLYIHNDLNSLQQHFSKDVLPSEYGGNDGVVQNIIDDWEKRLLENRDYFIEGEKSGINEMDINLMKSKDNNLFGLDGSFRKLEFD